MPALVYRKKIDVSFVTKNYYHLMTSTLLSSVLSAAGAYVKSRWAKKSALNPKGSTGNFIVDFYYGREFNPSYGVRGGFLSLSFFHYIIGNGLANIYNHNWIKMDPLLINGEKPLQHVLTLVRQLVFDASSSWRTSSSSPSLSTATDLNCQI